MIKALFLLILGTAIAHAELRVVTDFEGGNAEVVTLDQAAAKLRIMPALHEGRGWPCWWFLRLDGTTAGQKITLEVQGQTRPFRPDTVLASSWCQPDQAVLSHDSKTWQQTIKAERTADKVAIYNVQAEGPSLWLAWGPPFVPTTAESVLAGVKAKLGDEAERFELAKTRDGRPVRSGSVLSALTDAESAGGEDTADETSASLSIGRGGGLRGGDRWRALGDILVAMVGRRLGAADGRKGDPT